MESNQSLPTYVQWLEQIGTTAADYAYGIASDMAGNIYIGGETQGNFAGINGGATDGWMAKYDRAGNQIWQQQLGTSADDSVYNISTDKDGNTYITGTTSGQLGSSSSGKYDAWVAKYDTQGNQLWLQQLGSISNDDARSVTTDSLGNVYITGLTWGAVDGLNAGEWDIWVAKYDATGNQQWVKQLGTPAEDTATSIVTDSSGNIYITGSTKGSLQRNQGDFDAWVAKYDSDGNMLWLEQLGTAAEDKSLGAATDSAGNVYITGWTNGNLAGTNQSFDAWLAKYDSAGNLVWRQQIGSSGSDGSLDIAIDNQNRIYISGATSGNIVGRTAGETDAWVAAYDTNGNRLSTKQFGGAGFDAAFGIAPAPDGNLYLGGWTSSNLDTEAPGVPDAWLAQIIPNQAPQIASLSKQVAQNTPVNFSSGNFQRAFVDLDQDNLAQIKITSLPNPDAGTLTLNGTPVAVNQEIAIGEVNNLTFTPGVDFIGDVRFTWNGSDGQDYAPTDAAVNLNTVKIELNLEWIREAGDFYKDIAQDSAGNLYIVGNTADFLGNQFLRPDLMMAKYDNNGNLLWEQKLGGYYGDYYTLNSLTIDNANNIYISGRTEEGDFFNPDIIGNANLTHPNWFAKYDTNGSLIFGEQGGIFGIGMLDDAGNRYTNGTTTGNLFGFYAGGSSDIVIAKYDPNNNLLWGQQIGSNGEESIQNSIIDDTGALYLIGNTTGNLFGTNADGGNNNWIAKYDANGNQLWGRQFDTGANRFNNIILDDDGNLYLTANIYEPLPTTSITMDPPVPRPPRETLITKYDANGNQVWEQRFDSSQSETYDTHNLTIDSDGNLYLTGSRYNNRKLEAWIVKYDNNGNQVWQQQLGGDTDVYYPESNLNIDREGNLYLMGHTYGNLFGINAGNETDIWLAKYGSNGNFIWGKQFGSEVEDRLSFLNHNIIDEDGNLYLTGQTIGNLFGTNAGGYDGWLAKYNSDGNLIWGYQFGSENTIDYSRFYSKLFWDENQNIYISNVPFSGMEILKLREKIVAPLSGSAQQGTPENDVLVGDAESNELLGSQGDDALDAAAGNDSLYGGKDNDVLIGGDGDDWLSGDKGNDSLTGGSGGDVFLLKRGDGTDVIADFNPGEDMLGLAAGLSLGDITITGGDTGAAITAGDEVLATFNGVDASEISIEDFLVL